MNPWAAALVRAGGEEDGGILRFPDSVADENIASYRAVGGSRITERAGVPFAMTSLDTPVLHAFLDRIAPASLDAPIVDVGGGDGRNAMPWLERGYRRVIVVEPAGEALARLRDRIAARGAAWLERTLLIQAEARNLPLVDGCAMAVIASESLYYLDEDYEIGLRECVRILAPAGRLLLSERDREGALILQLLYGNLEAMLRSYRTNKVWDGPERARRSRSFSEANCSRS